MLLSEYVSFREETTHKRDHDCICSSFIYSMIMQPSAHIGFRRKCKIEQNIFENYSFLM